ncbi:tRNA pseudouridine(38-40) synthase TruA [Plectonema cf. radiosum LEGE 06105]|uniref:tRNA pseudouridine synthase A n=1 Tax=Plectonema cf. radiosum LEGE 06105 TaxID=945769 RepID=A0A8J7F0N5_9CYAN|nr:tRNA pseudouridine(38-40) synthase TruA [Plectonema radiosum]MBE9212522.1 tRNA pseudouridine(38-40) synthase TruA [Plectonema cf. radiosum LEGE 06105]
MLESSQPVKTQRIALVIQYQGTHFHGWQKQPKYCSIQEEIEKAISTVVGDDVTLYGAGRTDSGVHAAAQVAHFNIASKIPPSKWSSILNSYLPQDILIRASAGVSDNWHARFSAAYRRYRYTIYNEKLPNLFVKPFSWHYYHASLDESLIRAALQPLIGKHHLAAFHRANSERKHSWVDVQAVECYRDGALVHIEIQADGFLYGMVRLLVGMLVQVGSGQRSVLNFTNIWKQERRNEVRYAAPPQGLCLLRVGYREFPFPAKIWYDTLPKFNLSDNSVNKISDCILGEITA